MLLPDLTTASPRTSKLTQTPDTEHNPDPAVEAAAAAKEKAEQEALPYKWTQTIKDVDVSFEVPGNYKGKDLVVEIKKQKLTAGVKGQEPIISVSSREIFAGTQEHD